ncbi:MAG: COX15/CtaA family protein [Planctomycetota bacterium]
MKFFTGLFVVILFCQLLLGALMRHRGIGLIIPDFPTSFGKLFPPFNNLPYNPNAPFPITYSEFKINVILTFTHRFLGFLIFLFASGILLGLRKYNWGDRRVIKLAMVIFFEIIFQIILGALIISMQAPTILTVLHTLVGASILGLSVVFLLAIFKPSQLENL